MEIDKELYSEIKEYCALNNIKTKEYITSLLRKAFIEDKYGKAPNLLKRTVTEEKQEQAAVVTTKNEPKEIKIVVEETVQESEKAVVGNSIAKEERTNAEEVEKQEEKSEIKPKIRKIKAK